MSIQKNNITTTFKVTIEDAGVAVDISTATTKQIHFGKPDETTLSKTAAFFTDGTDGILTYDSIANDLDTTGVWRIQAYVVLSGGREFHSSVGTFQVHDNIV